MIEATTLWYFEKERARNLPVALFKLLRYLSNLFVRLIVLCVGKDQMSNDLSYQKYQPTLHKQKNTPTSMQFLYINIKLSLTETIDKQSIIRKMGAQNGISTNECTHKMLCGILLQLKLVTCMTKFHHYQHLCTYLGTFSGTF